MNGPDRGDCPRYDIIVAGAGPSGTAAARYAAEKGLSVLCIEEHGTIGHPVQCAGLLSVNAFSECQVSDHSVLNNRVSGAEVITGLGSRLLIDAGRTKALVVDRGILDREMAWAAASAGAEFQLKTAVCRVHKNRVVTRGVNGKKEFGFKILIAADGPRSTISRLQGMKRAQYYLSGLQAEIAGENNPGIVSIYPDASPEFFAWRIPVSPHRARIGLAGMSDVKERFFRFQSSFTGASLDFVTGTIPLGVMPVTFGNRTLYVGDAAGFAKPTSGGGVYTGVRSARHAIETAAKCINADTFDDASLSLYEDLWKQDMGKELSLGLLAFRLRQTLGPVETDRLVKALSEPEMVEIIRSYGDMDRPARVIRELLKKPSLYPLSLMLIRCGFRMLTRDISRF